MTVEAKRGPPPPSPLGGSVGGTDRLGRAPRLSERCLSIPVALVHLGCGMAGLLLLDLIDARQAHRRRRKVVGHRLVHRDRSRRGSALEPELGEVDLVDRRHALLGPTERGVAPGTAVDLAPRRVTVARPDELVDDDRAAAGDAARRVELLDVLFQRDVDASGARQLRECRIEDGRVGRGQEGDGRELAEGAGIGGDGAHVMRHGPPCGPPDAGPWVEDGVTGRREGGELGVDDVVGR